jgi:hypothetical protein
MVLNIDSCCLQFFIGLTWHRFTSNDSYIDFEDYYGTEVGNNVVMYAITDIYLENHAVLEIGNT